MKILGKYWFTNKDGVIGIVRVKTDFDGVKYYIGSATGTDEDADAAYIAEWGSTFPAPAGRLLFGVTGD